MKIVESIINTIENKIYEYEEKYVLHPEIIILSPFMIELIRENSYSLINKYCSYSRHKELEYDTIYGLRIFSSQKIVNLEDIEVY